MRLHSQLMRERRKVPRYSFGVGGRLHSAGGRVGTDVVVRLISTSGCAIDRADGLKVGEKCELYFDWRGAEMGMEAQVVSRVAGGRIGLKFLSLNKDSQNRLSELCATLNIQPLSAPHLQDAGAPPYLRDSTTAQPPGSHAAPVAAAPSPRPKPARGSERRRVPRYVSELPARLSNPATGATSNVTLVTLSVLGGCVEGSRLPEAGQKCELKTEWEGKPLTIQGEVVWKTKEERVGVHFASLDEGEEKLLRQVCANLRLQPLAPLPRGPE